jgi:hypothetical protein
MMFDPHAAPSSLYGRLFWFVGPPETDDLIFPGLVWAIIADTGGDGHAQFTFE